MKIQIDSREKARAIKSILSEFDKQGVEYFVSKLYVADYCNIQKPQILIDRKQNIAELAQNATGGHARFKRELERLKQIDGKLYILIEQSKIGNKPIICLEDVMVWKPKYGTIIGLQIYKILSAWRHKYNIEFVFCSKRNTGKKIIELLS